MIELSDEEVDLYIAEKYLGKDTNLYQELNSEFEKKNKKDNKKISDKILKSMGIRPIEVYADTRTKSEDIGGVDDDENPSMLKKFFLLHKRRRVER